VTGRADLTAVSRGDAGGGPVIECRKAAKTFSGLRALHDIDLAVDPGEIVGLVGPNGSGKSTLINVLSGMFAPTSGQVLFQGQDITGRPPHAVSRLGIARTYQIPRPFATMTVLENVALAAMFHSESTRPDKARDAAWEYLDFTRLSGVAHELPDNINLHQRKFLELARALATRPTVLMLDEVLTGLNPREIDESVEMIRKIHASGITIVIVEHLMRVVTQLATRMVVLKQGEFLATGPPDEVMKNPDVITAYLGREHA
jgi:branched-chain amino acid transport system permease protein